jgi:hypothetical protein
MFLSLHVKAYSEIDVPPTKGCHSITSSSVFMKTGILPKKFSILSSTNLAMAACSTAPAAAVMASWNGAMAFCAFLAVAPKSLHQCTVQPRNSCT